MCSIPVLLRARPWAPGLKLCQLHSTLTAEAWPSLPSSGLLWPVVHTARTPAPFPVSGTLTHSSTCCFSFFCFPCVALEPTVPLATPPSRHHSGPPSTSPSQLTHERVAASKADYRLEDILVVTPPSPLSSPCRVTGTPLPPPPHEVVTAPPVPTTFECSS